MRAEDGDFVPQPLRAMAFIRIAEHWAEYYEVGVGSGLDPQDTSGTLATIIMVESWFEHRAVHVDEDGNLDLAVRAYRKGISPAQAGGAEAYLENVKRKRERYVQGRSPSPTWAFSSVTRVGAALGSRLRGPMKQRRDGGANERLPSEWARHGTAAPRCTPH
jgi:hypothetical protein